MLDDNLLYSFLSIFLVLMGSETICLERTCLRLVAGLKGWLLEKGYTIRPHSYKLVGPDRHGCNPIHFEPKK